MCMGCSFNTSLYSVIARLILCLIGCFISRINYVVINVNVLYFEFQMNNLNKSYLNINKIFHQNCDFGCQKYTYMELCHMIKIGWDIYRGFRKYIPPPKTKNQCKKILWFPNSICDLKEIFLKCNLMKDNWQKKIGQTKNRATV